MKQNLLVKFAIAILLASILAFPAASRLEHCCGSQFGIFGYCVNYVEGDGYCLEHYAQERERTAKLIEELKTNQHVK